MFEANTPAFFDPSERAEFAGFLHDPGAYLVLTDGRVVVGCGGIAPCGTTATLTWGMVARDRHRQGLGLQLLQARVDLARAAGMTALSCETSQHSRGFYERQGFRVTSFTPDGFGPGLDRIAMVRPL